MSTDPLFLNRFPLQPHFDIPSTLEATEGFLYASCPHCHARRARVSKQIKEYKTLFRIHCSDCGYDDDDVGDY